MRTDGLNMNAPTTETALGRGPAIGTASGREPAETPSHAPRALLMVSYAYPPLGSPGSLRTAKFAKYLPEHGWRPVVITPRGPCSRVMTGLEDHVDLPGVRVIRSYEPAAAGLQRAMSRPKPAKGFKHRLIAAINHLVIPDRTISWYPFAVRAAAEAVRNERVAAVYSTSPSITVHLIARTMARRYKIPWVADFRDLWTQAPTYDYQGWRARIDRTIERRILRDADRILVVSEGPKEQLAQAYPEFAGKVAVLCNGFDHQDLEGVRRGPPAEKFVLTYCGMFYGGKRSPESLLRAMAELKRQGILSAANFTFRVIGRAEEDVLGLVQRLGVGELTEFTGHLPHREAVAGMAGASAGLVITMTDERSRGEMPSKYYECLGVRRPILALSPPHFELARLTEAIGAGTAIHPQDQAGIARWLAEQVRHQAAHGPADDLDESLVRGFSRAAGAAQLAQCLDELIG